MPEPIRPSRVYRADELPPAPDPDPVAPPAEPAPPWWTAPAPPPGPLVVHHIHHLATAPPAPPPAVPDPGWEWSALWSWARWRHAGGAAAALAPLFGGWSCATGWGRALQNCRTEQAIAGAWTLGGLALLVAVTITRWRPRWYTTALAVTAVFGLADVASPFDLVTFFTGVHQ